MLQYTDLYFPQRILGIRCTDESFKSRKWPRLMLVESTMKQTYTASSFTNKWLICQSRLTDCLSHTRCHVCHKQSVLDNSHRSELRKLLTPVRSLHHFTFIQLAQTAFPTVTMVDSNKICVTTITYWLLVRILYLWNL